VHPVMEDMRSLLIAGRNVLAAPELDGKRLQLWGAERNAIFARLKERDPALASGAPTAMEPLLRELVDLDQKICARIVEIQRELGLQIAAARKVRQALRYRISPAPQLLQRLA
jgi:hypothetical protein